MERGNLSGGPVAKWHRRIAELLDAAVERTVVTLVLAPRGYGKTTAVSNWVSDRESVTWLLPDTSAAGALSPGHLDPLAGHEPDLVLVADNADELDPVLVRGLLSRAFDSPEAPRVVLCGHPGLLGRCLGELAGRAYSVIGAADLEPRSGEERANRLAHGGSSWPAAVAGPASADHVVHSLLAVLEPEAGRTLLDAAMLASFDTGTLMRVVGAEAIPHIADWISAGAPLIATEVGSRTTFTWAEGFGSAAYRRAAAANQDAASAALRAGAEEVAREHPLSAAKLAVTCGHAELAGAVVLRGWPELVFGQDRDAVLSLIDALPGPQQERPDIQAVRDVVSLWGNGGEPIGAAAIPVAADRIRDLDLAAFHRLAVASDAAAVAAAEPGALHRIAATDSHRWVALQHLLAVIMAWWRPGRSTNMVRLESLVQVGASEWSPFQEARFRLDRATELAFTGSFNEAMDLLTSVDSPDDDGRIRALLAMIGYWRGDFDTTRRLAADLTVDHKVGQFWRTTAQILDANVQHDSGVEPAVLRRAVATIPANLDLAEIDVHRRVLEAYLHEWEGRNDQARNALARLTQGEMSPALQVVVAVALARVGAHAKAEKILDEALNAEQPIQLMVTGLLCRAVCEARKGSDAQARISVGLALAAAKENAIWGPFLVADTDMGAMLLRTAHVGIGADDTLYGVLVERALRRSGAIVTERERDVYRLLAANLTIAEIAERIGIAVSTAKGHTQSLYRRLGVTDRISAVELMV